MKLYTTIFILLLVSSCGVKNHKEVFTYVFKVTDYPSKLELHKVNESYGFSKDILSWEFNTSNKEFQSLLKSIKLPRKSVIPKAYESLFFKPSFEVTHSVKGFSFIHNHYNLLLFYSHDAKRTFLFFDSNT